MIRTLVRRTITSTLSLLFLVVRVKEAVLSCRVTRRYLCYYLVIIALIPPLMLFVFLLHAFQGNARPFLHILPCFFLSTFRKRLAVLNFVENISIQTMIFLSTLREGVPVTSMHN